MDTWEPDSDIFNLNGDQIDFESTEGIEITKSVGDAPSGSYYITFQFQNVTGYGTLWLEKKIQIDHFNKYSIEIEFYHKLESNFNEVTGITTELKPMIYIGKDNPEALTDEGFESQTVTMSDSWEPFVYHSGNKVNSPDEVWIAFGLWFEFKQISTGPGTGSGGDLIGANLTYYLDDLRITIEEHDLAINELGILFLKATIMFIIGGILIFLAIRKQYEPLLLLPIGTGIILTNIPFIGMMEPGGILYLIYQGGIKTTLFPLLIFLGIGAMTDFGPMLANPKTSLLGAAAQFGIFTTLFGAILLGFSLSESASIGIIGGADGPTAIYLSIHLAPHLLGPIAIAAYSYMALVPIIQPPIINALTTEKERKVKMEQMRFVSPRERMLFPIGVIIICAFLLQEATPLIGMLMFGNLMRESGVVQRLANTASNELINIVTIFLGISVGATMMADSFLTFQTIAIIILGLLAFSIGTATGVLFGKAMCKFSGGKVNPMIGAAGVSAVPMAARVVQKMGVKADPNNHLLMHAMGPNVAGVIGSAVVAGVLLKLVGG